MRKAVAFIALLVSVSLAGCTGSPSTSAGTASPGQSAATSGASATPVLTCPAPASGVAKLRVVARDVTLRDRPGKLADGTVVLGLIPNGQVIELKQVGQGPWRQVACGERIGWALADNGQSGADRRVWLEPIS